MSLESLLNEYSEEQKLSKTLSLDEDSVCHLLINDTVRITFELLVGDDAFYLYGIVGIVPPEKTEAVLFDTMQANLFGKETGTAVLGIDPETRTLVLFERFSESKTDYETFRKHLETFLTLLEYWRQRLETKLPALHAMDEELKTLRGKQKLKIFMA